VSAIEKIEERFEAVRQAAFDGSDSSIAIWPVQFRAALAEAWAKGYAASDYEAYHLGTHGRTDNPYREEGPS
jgi:hypothetical protein